MRTNFPLAGKILIIVWCVVVPVKEGGGGNGVGLYCDPKEIEPIALFG